MSPSSATSAENLSSCCGSTETAFVYFRREWSPRYDERFAAVGKTIGAAHCRVMGKQAFAKHSQQHPEMFLQP
jgi:hypothetical protein